MIEVVGQSECENVKYLPLWVLPMVNGIFCHFRDLDYRIVFEYFSKFGTAVIKALKKKHTKHYELLRYLLLFPVDQH